MQLTTGNAKLTQGSYFDQNQLQKADQAKTKILVVKDSSGVQVHRLDRMIFTIGRSNRADIQVLDQEVSRIHATLIRKRDQEGNPQYHLFDGDARISKPSQNGTRINGIPVSQHVLANTDRIQLGLRGVVRFFDLSTDKFEKLNCTPEQWFQAQLQTMQAEATVWTELGTTNISSDQGNSENMTSPLISSNLNQS
jgi:pSer/pThr/pTyr-binding forkhead associated (FHA) protein